MFGFKRRKAEREARAAEREHVHRLSEERTDGIMDRFNDHAERLLGERPFSGTMDLSEFMSNAALVHLAALDRMRDASRGGFTPEDLGKIASALPGAFK